MKTDPVTAANAFMKLFPKSEADFCAPFHSENDEEIIFNHLRFAEQIFPKHGLMLCPVSHVKSRFVSMNCENILGHGYAELLKMDLPDFFSLVHPHDLPLVQQCLLFIKNIKPYDPADYRFLMYYRIRNNSGNYVHILDEKLAIKTSVDRYMHLLLFSHVPQEEKFHHMKLEIYKNIKGKHIKAYTYNPAPQQKSITPRQQDIANLIARGFTTQEIADQLNVSINTVKNHKQMLFRKVNVRNSIELANYIKSN